MTIEDSFVVLLRLSLHEGGLSKDSIKQLRLTSRKLRDSLDQQFWRSINVSTNLSEFLDLIGADNNIASLIKHLTITDYKPSEYAIIKLVDILPRLVNVENMDLTDFRADLTSDLANKISPRPHNTPWHFSKRDYTNTIDFLHLDCDCFWDIVWERHHGQTSSLSLTQLFPKLKHIKIQNPVTPLAEKHFSRVPDVQFMRVKSAEKDSLTNIIGILHATPSLIRLQLENISDLRVSNDNQTVAFPNITELSIDYGGEDKTLMACLKLFPNLKIFKPWSGAQVVYSDGMSKGVAQFLKRHCRHLDTISLFEFTYLFKFSHLQGIRYIRVHEPEDTEDSEYYIKVFRAMPKQWRRTIETVEIDGMRVVTRQKCEQVYEQLFTPNMGYTSFRKLVLKYDEVNAGAVLNVQNGAVTDYFKFGSAPEGVNFAHDVGDVYPDELFVEDDEEDIFGEDEESE